MLSTSKSSCKHHLKQPKKIAMKRLTVHLYSSVLETSKPCHHRSAPPFRAAPSALKPQLPLHPHPSLQQMTVWVNKFLRLLSICFVMCYSRWKVDLLSCPAKWMTQRKALMHWGDIKALSSWEAVNALPSWTPSVRGEVLLLTLRLPCCSVSLRQAE